MVVFTLQQEEAILNKTIGVAVSNSDPVLQLVLPPELEPNRSGARSLLMRIIAQNAVATTEFDTSTCSRPCLRPVAVPRQEERAVTHTRSRPQWRLNDPSPRAGFFVLKHSILRDDCRSRPRRSLRRHIYHHEHEHNPRNRYYFPHHVSPQFSCRLHEHCCSHGSCSTRFPGNQHGAR